MGEIEINVMHWRKLPLWVWVGENILPGEQVLVSPHSLLWAGCACMRRRSNSRRSFRWSGKNALDRQQDHWLNLRAAGACPHTSHTRDRQIVKTLSFFPLGRGGEGACPVLLGGGAFPPSRCRRAETCHLVLPIPPVLPGKNGPAAAACPPSRPSHPSRSSRRRRLPPPISSFPSLPFFPPPPPASPHLVFPIPPVLPAHPNTPPNPNH